MNTNTIKFIVVVSIALLSADIIANIAYGLDYSFDSLFISPEEKQSWIKGEYETIINYCLEHADDQPNPIDQLMGKELNPVKDLVDKGLVGQHFDGENCGSVKKSYDDTIRFLLDNPSTEIK